MARPKSNGPYAPLSASYFYDDAILEAGEQAELLFVRTLAFLSSSASDGFVTELQMQRVIGAGLRRVPERVRKLHEVGLISTVTGGYLVRSWNKWNRSAEDIGKFLKRDRERKARNSAEKDTNSTRNPAGIHTDSAPQITTQQVTTQHSNSAVAEIRPEVLRLCNILADLIADNGSPRPNIGKGWLDAARLMIDNDKRPIAEALSLIQWCQAHHFWKANILSMPTFRSKYDQLRLQREGDGKTSKPSKQEQVLDVLEMGRRMQAEDDRKVVSA